MQTMTFTNMHDMSANIAQRFLLLNPALDADRRAILEHREVLCISVKDMPGCVRFVVPGAECTLKRDTGEVVA